MKQTSGYTLIELLLYITVVGLLLGGLVTFFVFTSSVRIKNQSIMEVDQQGLFIVDTITQAIRNADSVTSPALAASGTSLTLASTIAALNPTIINLSGATIQIKEGSAAALPLSNSRVSISNFSVKNLGRSGTLGSVQVSFTLSTVNTTGRSEYSYSKNFIAAASVR